MVQDLLNLILLYNEFSSSRQNIFTVGAYDMINMSMWPNLQRGPNIRDIQTKYSCTWSKYNIILSKQ